MLAKAMEKVPGVASTAVATKVTGGAGGTPGSAPSASTPRGNQARAQAQHPAAEHLVRHRKSSEPNQNPI
jgi:hypothetical protein